MGSEGAVFRLAKVLPVAFRYDVGHFCVAIDSCPTVAGSRIIRWVGWDEDVCEASFRAKLAGSFTSLENSFDLFGSLYSSNLSGKLCIASSFVVCDKHIEMLSS